MLENKIRIKITILIILMMCFYCVRAFKAYMQLEGKVGFKGR